MKHQEKLSKKMEKVYLYHNQIQQLIMDDTKNISNHPLMQKIDDWEKESILKVQQTAKEVRQQFNQAFMKYTIEMSELLTQMNQQLNQICLQNNYIETDIKLWLEKLNEFKKDFQTPKTINIKVNENDKSFINKIQLSQLSLDTFRESIGDIQTKDNNYTITHGPSNGDATIRGCKEYSSGTHKFRFRVEKLGIPKWIFFGIISKTAVSQSSLYKTPTVYGWGGHHQVWLNGAHYHQYENFIGEFNVDHVVELLIDCDQNKIRLNNETMAIKHEISVSPIKCPFPWMLYIGLYGSGDQVRLLFA